MVEGPFQSFSRNQDLTKAGINLCLSRIETCYCGNQILIFENISGHRKTISQLWRCNRLGRYTLRESLKPSSSAKTSFWPTRPGRLGPLKLRGRYRQGLLRSQGQEVSHLQGNSIEQHSIQISVKSLSTSLIDKLGFSYLDFWIFQHFSFPAGLTLLWQWDAKADWALIIVVEGEVDGDEKCEDGTVDQYQTV